jgi:hypothetical protein
VDCETIINDNESVIKRHVDVIAGSLIDGRKYVMSNCGRLANAGT